MKTGILRRMTTVIFRAIAIATLLLASNGVLSKPTHAEAPAQEGSPTAKEVRWLRYDVDLILRVDGTLHVAERQTVEFTGGPFTVGFADIPVREREEILSVSVSEIEQGGEKAYERVRAEDYLKSPGTYVVSDEQESVHIEWAYPETSDAARTFLLEYAIKGTLELSIDGNNEYGEIWWTAISTAVTDVAPVAQSTVTIKLPGPADSAQVLVSALGYIPTPTNDWSLWTWHREDLGPGDEFLVRLRYPGGRMPVPAEKPQEPKR